MLPGNTWNLEGRRLGQINGPHLTLTKVSCYMVK